MRGVLLALAFFATPALAQPVTPETVTPISIHGSAPVAPPPSTCPYGSSFADGCAGSPGGTIQHSNLAAYAIQSGQTWANPHPEGWNIPGADYAVGAITATASLADPSTFVATGGCAYSASGSTPGGTGALIECTTGSGTVTITGFDFSKHNCTVIKVDAGWTGTLIVKNNYWKNGSNCNNVAGTGYFIAATNPGAASLDIESNTADGDGYNQLNPMEGWFWLNTTGTLINQYNALINWPGGPFSYNTGSAGNNETRWNLIDGEQTRPYQGHWEINTFSVKTGQTLPTTDTSFNTIITHFNDCICGTTTIYTSNGNAAAGNYTNWTANNNVIVTNNVGGTLVQAGTMTGTVDNGLGTGPGNVFTVSGFTGYAQLTRGVSLQNGAHTFFLDTNLSGGTGVGGTWSVTCQAATTGDCNGTGSFNPSVQLSSLAYTSHAYTVSQAFTETAYNTFGQITFSQNYVDGTGGGGLATVSFPPNPTCTNPSIFSGNVNLVTGGAISGYTATAGGC